MSKKILFAVALTAFSCMSFSAPAAAEQTDVNSIVVFGDSLSDNGNTAHLLKSLRQVDEPSFLVSPLKTFVFRKMDDFANDYYVPTSILLAGKQLAREFFDVELAPLLSSIVAVIKTVPIIPEAPYWHYHFTDGKVWNETLATDLGLNLNDPEQYYNNAYGGSWASTYDYQLTTWNVIRHPVQSITNLIQGKLIPPSLGLEITAYLLNFDKASPEKTYFIFAGSNDYLNMLNFEDNYNPVNMSSYVDHVVSGILYSMERLVSSGAKKVVLFGVPDIGITPNYRESMDHDFITKACTWHNERLQEGMEAFKAKYPEVKITFINTQEVFGKLFEQAAANGISNTKDACVDMPLPGYAFTSEAPSHKAFGYNLVLEYTQYMKTPNASGGFTNNFHTCSNPKKYAFWDIIHPTAVAHKVLSSTICGLLEEDGYRVKCKS